ncbi:MAG: 2-oxo acid dehydrogenase subunit E2, partial [Candidatus Thermofonsia bacterium]
MAEYVVMPKLGFDMREGVLNTWLKSVGDTVSRGEVLAEIESDKATLELESQVEGTLLAVLEDPGAIVPVGANVAIVGEPGEDISAMLSAGDGGADAEAEADTAVSDTPAAPVTEKAAGEKTAVSGEYPAGIKATPVARRIAAENNVDLSQVAGSGPGGRIRKADVEAFLAQPVGTAVPAPAAAAAPVVVGPTSEEVPLTRLRQAIARRMTESKTTVPHFYVTTEVDMQAALDLRKQINAALPPEEKVSVNDMIVKAAALALREFPNINASFAGDTLVRHHEINVGSAVAVEGGLLTIVQKNTDKATISTIAADHKAMIARAREGKIKPEDVEGSTFTVSNLGAFDVDHFIAIINPPNAAILAVGTARQV